MTPRDLDLWTAAVQSLLPPNRYTHTPRKWFMNTWYWGLREVYWKGEIRTTLP